MFNSNFVHTNACARVYDTMCNQNQ